MWARILEFILTKQSKGRVIIATGMTDKEMMALLEKKHEPSDKHVANDHTKFDSTQNEVASGLTANALRHIGFHNKTVECPEWLIELLLAQMTTRQISADIASLIVHLKLDSGQPFTLIHNCLWNLAITLDTIKGARVVLIKGDDSICFGAEVEFDMQTMKMYTNDIGCQFKPEESMSGEFVGFIINKYGASFDLTRLAAKVLTRNYKDLDDYKDYRTAVGVILRDIPASAGHNMVRVNSYHHTLSLDATPDFDACLSFLFNFAEGKISFDRTVVYESRNYITDGVNNLLDHHEIDKSKFQAIPVVKIVPTSKYAKGTKFAFMR
jgi:hypothetical protein